jgi:adenylate cyclase
LERRLAAILAADVVGYSRLMGADEAGTLAALKAHQRELFDPKISEHHGRIVKLMGDGALVEFPSVVEAVTCAAAIQRGMAMRNAGLDEGSRIAFRIGINLGDVIVEGDDIYGDGVNVAARLEGLAEPGGICVSNAVHEQIRDKLDLAMEDLGAIQVKNIARPVQAFRVVTAGDTAEPPGKRRRTRLRPAVGAAAVILVAAVGALVWLRPWTATVETVPIERPSDLPAIAVLPFDNMSGDPEQEYFSDGITEDLITDLSRVSGLFVIARNSVFTYKDAPVKVQQVGRELGVAYVVEGSVRKAGDRVRINAQLVDAATGRHLWADRYDRELTDVFALQDDVVQKIVEALAVRLTADEEVRLDQSAKVVPEAYDLLLRGLARLRRFTGEDVAAARGLFERAIAVDPQFARAHADIAWTHALDVAFGWTDSPDDSLQQAVEMAEHALALDESVPQVHMALSSIHRRQRRFDDSVAAARRAIELDPNYADGYAQLANSLIYEGRPEEALKAIDTATRLNPRNPFFFRQIVGHAHFLSGRYDEAAAAFEKVLERNPHFISARLTLAAAYAHLGRIEEAEWEAQEILTLQPNFTLAQEQERSTYNRPADLERYIGGLRKAGLPE